MTALDTGISINMFYGDHGDNAFISKMFQAPYKEHFHYWFLNIIEQNREQLSFQKLLSRLPEEKGVLLLNVNRFTPSELLLENGKSLVDFSRVNRVGGGTIGCDRLSLEAWHRAYYETFRSYRNTQRFVGNDESLMATTCLETDLCLLVEPSYYLGKVLSSRLW